MHNRFTESPSQNIVGIVPMAGTASRLGKLPCSKEIHPVDPPAWTRNADNPPRVVCEYLLGKMRAAGITRIYAVLRQGKWDIPAHLGDGSRDGLHLAYLMMGLPYGTPYSIDQAYPFVQDSIVALGFPDMVLPPGNFFEVLLNHQQASNADAVLGLFPADRPDKVDMLEVDDEGTVKQIIIKPADTHLRFTWGVAVWTSTFSRFMHEFLASHRNIAAAEPELFVGDILQAGIEDGLNIRAVQVSKQPYLDIGTTDDLRAATNPLARD